MNHSGTLMHRKLQILNVTAMPQIAPLPGRRYKNGTNPIPISAYTLKGTILPPTNKYSNCRTNRAAAVNALFHSEFTVSAADGLYKRTGLNASYRFSELFELLTSHGEDWPCAAMALILEYKRRTALINDTSLLWHLSHWNLGTMKLS